MKRQIRKSVFETNSSMTHSLTICTEEEYKKYENEELYYCNWEENFKTEEELRKEFEEYKKKYDYKDSDINFIDWRRDEGYYLYNERNNYNDYLESYKESFTTPSGDKMVAFGCYGHD